MAEWLRDDLQADWNACRRVAHLPVPDQCSSLLMEAAREQLWAPRKEGFMRVQHLTLLNCAQRDHDKDRSLVLCSTSLGFHRQSSSCVNESDGTTPDRRQVVMDAWRHLSSRRSIQSGIKDRSHCHVNSRRVNFI
ncbi:hypothetical protein V3C99_005868 [Haemonchus contortus]